MWPTIRFAAARQLRVGSTASSLVSSRVVARPASPIIPASFRLQLSRRAFSEDARLFKAAAAAGGRKRTTKKKAPSKKTTAKASPKKAKKRAKKPVSEEDRVKLKSRELKKAVLKEPATLPTRPWLVYLRRQLHGAKLGQDSFGQTIKALGEEFKALPASEAENLRETAEQNKLANDAARRSWVEGHSPQQIAEANRARRHLRQINKKFRGRLIKDERQPKRAFSPYLLFVKSRWQSGDFSGRPAIEATKDIASEWKSLSDAERRPFFDNAKVDHDRYVKEKESILGA